MEQVTVPHFNAESPRVHRFFKDITSSFKQAMFMWGNLPAAAFMGIKVQSVDLNRAEVTLPYAWRSQNPFKSIYFAAQCAAAELSTGILAMGILSGFDRKVSMLVTDLQADFVKKANQKTTFTCEDGQQMIETIQRAVQSGEGQVFQATSTGRMPDGTVVSVVKITWSFKVKK